MTTYLAFHLHAFNCDNPTVTLLSSWREAQCCARSPSTLKRYTNIMSSTLLLHRHCLMLMVVVMAISYSTSFTSFQCGSPPSTVLFSALTEDGDSDNRIAGRREFVIASALAITQPHIAYALQEKNELLCNTGFFTNVGAWYCTGKLHNNISDMFIDVIPDELINCACSIEQTLVI